MRSATGPPRGAEALERKAQTLRCGANANGRKSFVAHCTSASPQLARSTVANQHGQILQRNIGRRLEDARSSEEFLEDASLTERILLMYYSIDGEASSRKSSDAVTSSKRLPTFSLRRWDTNCFCSSSVFCSDWLECCTYCAFRTLDEIPLPDLLQSKLGARQCRCRS